MKMPAFLRLVPNTEHSNQLLRTRWSIPLAHFIYGYLKLQKSALVTRYTPARTHSHLFTEDASGAQLTFKVTFRDLVSQHATETLTAQCEMTFHPDKVGIKLNQMADPLSEYISDRQVADEYAQ